ncbi:glycosyltransferase [Nocardioides conyzicola]|uniref:Glycosyl transferase family 28 C-terminal domain-containing protein n=1 Tax=Nocardioides conyzicola TaxID=1651781 RepID=A0ABP8XYH9_9ACTN
MIGYYVHHHGRGHLHRALALAAALDEPVTGLSSLPAPAGWSGPWVQLERDDIAPTAVDPTAHGRLHWVPRGDAGLSTRTAQISAWLDEHRPRVLVADVSVEVALLGRLHGVPVVTVVLPGQRADAAHQLGFDISTHLVAMWPPEAQNMLPGLPTASRERVRPLGALSRYPVRLPTSRRPGPPRVVLMTGGGGDDLTPDRIDSARRQSEQWEWVVLGRHGRWSEDPRADVHDADVVITNAGQNSLAEIAAARTAAIVIPQDRPYDEQRTSAAALAAGGWPVLVEDRFPDRGWSERLRRAQHLDGDAWSSWCDGRAAERLAELISS